MFVHNLVPITPMLTHMIPYVSILYCYNVYAFDNKNIETYTVFLTNSCLLLVFSTSTTTSTSTSTTVLVLDLRVYSVRTIAI